MIDLDFRHLVSSHKSKVYNTCLGLVRKREDAEDLSQEVFIEAYRHWDQYRHEAATETWLYRIAVNKSLEFMRKNNRQKRKGHPVEIDMALTESVMIDYEHPGITLENKERSNLLMQQINKLPENQRVAFVLNKIEGLSYKEIAQIMKKSGPSVESLLYRAKTNLKNLLKDYYHVSKSQP